MKTLVKDFSYRGEHYSIVYDGKFYMTVNHKFIGDDGRLVKELKFSDGLHPADSIDQCIEQTKNDLDMKYYTANGMTKAEAFAKIFNIPIEMAEELFKIA